MFFFEKKKFWSSKFSLSPDPVILDLKLQLADSYSSYLNLFDRSFTELILHRLESNEAHIPDPVISAAFNDMPWLAPLMPTGLNKIDSNRTEPTGK